MSTRQQPIQKNCTCYYTTICYLRALGPPANYINRDLNRELEAWIYQLRNKKEIKHVPKFKLWVNIQLYISCNLKTLRSLIRNIGRGKNTIVIRRDFNNILLPIFQNKARHMGTRIEA